ncbi:MAG TPA: MFS transporter, partial [Nevskia sp.]|nr:MFS transporter [Nevskia sp.]
WGGVLSVVFSPVAANLAARFDARYLIFFGVMWLGLDLFWRSAANTDMTYWQICVPLFFMGVGMPMFYVPLTGVAMASVNEEETAAASGLMNFVRTISGAIATSLVNTVWEDKSKHFHAELANVFDPARELAHGISILGQYGESARAMVNTLVDGQSLMLATNSLMTAIGVVFVCASFLIVLAPKPTRTVDATAVGH